MWSYTRNGNKINELLVGKYYEIKKPRNDKQVHIYIVI